MYSTHRKGEIAQLKVELRAIEKGIVPCRPLVESRFDLILVGEKVEKVQVKYASYTHHATKNSISVDLRKQCRNNGKPKKYTKDEVDVVMVYLPEQDCICRLEANMFHGKSSVNIRLKPAKNGQTKGVLLLEDLVW